MLSINDINFLFSIVEVLIFLTVFCFSKATEFSFIHFVGDVICFVPAHLQGQYSLKY